MSTKKERMNEDNRRHGVNLCALFQLDEDPVKLAKKLLKLELQARDLTTKENNGDISLETCDVETELILDKVDKITGFRAKGIPVFIQGDSRGSTLQIDDEYIRKNRVTLWTNMGGCGVLAPIFDGEV